MTWWQIILLALACLVVILLALNYVFTRREIRENARRLATARASQRFQSTRKNEVRRTDSHYSTCDRKMKDRIGEWIIDCCAHGERLRISYPEAIAYDLERVTRDYSVRQLRQFEKEHQKAVKVMKIRDRTIDSLEQFTQGIEDAERRRKVALEEVRSWST